MRAVLLAAIVGAGGAFAQASYTGPAELPPENFSGNQYVDSRGCAYVRTGLEGAINWLPRVSRDRTPICGLEPTLVSALATPTPVPIPVVSTTTAAAAAPVVAPATVSSLPMTAAPRAQVAPRRAATVPPGFEPVWNDDRLNPNRARGTATGQAEMERVWTDDVPRTLANPQHPGKDLLVYLEVAQFGSTRQRNSVVNRLKAEGLPARPAVIRVNGRDTPAVLLGPYSAPVQAAADQRLVRSMGYPATTFY